MSKKTMKVCMNVDLADDEMLYEQGKEYDVPVELGKKLCAYPQDEPRATPVAETPVDRAERPRPMGAGAVERRG